LFGAEIPLENFTAEQIYGRGEFELERNKADDAAFYFAEVELKLFDTVVRHRSMTRAAAEAGVSQSAVSQSIRHLEDFVQAPLLVNLSG
jgi:molybdenum-dependent DNA-binding transcriptional regulator ModE